MNRIIASVGAALALTACTPMQLATFHRVTGAELTNHETHTLIALPDAPMRLADGRQINPDGSLSAKAKVTGRCAEWYPTARAAGFTAAQWPTVARIMYRESRCMPGAYNRSGATGLMQIMPMWARSCGGTPSSLFDAAFNLRCAVHILRVQGWGAWAL
jgi:hypothetical protein